jgi:hypothetical protein
MIELVFENERLREGHTQLAWITPAAVIAYRGADYQIVRTKPHGWHYALQAPEGGGLLWEFVPFRLLRGGRLRSDSATITLRGRMLAPTS